MLFGCCEAGGSTHSTACCQSTAKLLPTLLCSLPVLCADGASGLPEAAGTLGLPGAALPSTPELVSGGHLESGEMLSSGGHAVAAASAVAALPWHLLPSNLESLSLSGFAGLKADNIKAVAEAAPQLRYATAVPARHATAF